MTSGNDWIENLTLNPMQPNSFKNGKPIVIRQVQKAIPYIYHHKTQPKH